MTLDLITAARHRVRRVAVGVVVALCLLGALVYVAGLYANNRLDDQLQASGIASSDPHPSTEGRGLLPADVTWAALAGVDLPVSASTGPAERSGGLARGFAHNAVGAVVAAVHLLVRTTPQVGPAVFGPTFAEQVTGDDASAMAERVGLEYRQACDSMGIPYGQPLGDLPATLVGVRIDTATEDHVVVSVFTSIVDASGSTRYTTTPVTVIWQRQDWRLLAPPDGRWDQLVRLAGANDVASYDSMRR